MTDPIKKFSDICRKAKDKKRCCMYDDCSLEAIRSHVLQKNGILNLIAEKGHLVQLTELNPYEFYNGDLPNLKSLGIKHVLTFKGFCKFHDSEIFKAIENSKTLDLYSKKHQALFCYRGLCQEIRRKEIVIEILEDSIAILPEESLKVNNLLLFGNRQGLKNLHFFRKELEDSLKNNDYSSFVFETLEIPKIDVCISTPLSLGKLNPPIDNDFEKWRANLPNPFITSFINVFPMNNKSYLITGYHKDYTCNWTNALVNKIKLADDKMILKEISDLIVLRLEFWAMSQTLFKKIPKAKWIEYNKIFSENVLSHDNELETKFNLFADINTD